MKRLRYPILIVSLVILSLAIPCRAEMVSISEARAAASNWINLIIHNQNSWCGAPAAAITQITPLKRGGRKLGYFGKVSPRGYIVLSMLKELSPVTDFSCENNLDPDLDEGMIDLIKSGIEQNLKAIEKRVRSLETASTEALERIIPKRHRDAWAVLLMEPDTFRESLGDIQAAANYQEGQELLSSRWHQYYPFNMWCPTPPTGSGCTENNCTVGCVGLSAAEIMRYWNWPPYGTTPPYDTQYTWWYMPDRVDSNSPISERVAVAELCSEVANAIDSDFCIDDGCATSSNFTLVKYAIENYFRYATASPELFRKNYNDENWFNIIRAQIDMNRPVQYSYPGHAIVADGWMEVYPGQYRYLHLCYGFQSETHTDWHLLASIPGGDRSADVIMIDIYPEPAIGPSPSGVYAVPSFPYRYFDRDCASSYAIFQAGHNLQFLPGITVSSAGSIKFESSGTLESRLFTRGDTSSGIRLNNGGISLYANGNLILY